MEPVALIIEKGATDYLEKIIHFLIPLSLPEGKKIVFKFFGKEDGFQMDSYLWLFSGRNYYHFDSSLSGEWGGRLFGRKYSIALPFYQGIIKKLII